MEGLKIKPQRISLLPVRPVPIECAPLLCLGKISLLLRKNFYRLQMSCTQKQIKKSNIRLNRLKDRNEAAPKRRGKRAFALTEVLVSCVILGVCASAVAPYFQNMFKGYQQIRDRMRGEYLLEEALTSAYTTYLTNPPAFEEIVQGLTSRTEIEGYTISCVLTKNLGGEERDSQSVCTGIVTVRIQKKAENSNTNHALAEGSMELCFQKRPL